jgi:hypothetical protein
MRRPSAHTKAALLYVLPVFALVGMWYLLLFTGNAPAVSALSTLAFLLTEGPMPSWFRWLLLLPAICATLGAAHLSPVTHTRSGSLCLFVLGTALSIAAWLTVSSEIAVVVSLPLLYAFLGARGHRSTSENGA